MLLLTNAFSLVRLALAIVCSTSSTKEKATESTPSLWLFVW